MTVRRVVRRGDDYRSGSDAARARADVESQGMTLPGRPGSPMPEVPEDITGLSDRDIMALYSAFVAWSEYASSQHALAVVDEKADARRAAQVESVALARKRAEGLNVTDARAAAKASDEVAAALDAAFASEAYRRVLETVVESCDKGSQLVSRELTRRTSGGERARRDGTTWTT